MSPRTLHIPRLTADRLLLRRFAPDDFEPYAASLRFALATAPSQS